MIQVKSSLIKAVKYDPETQNLVVQFHKGGLYTYHKVPEVVFDSFLGSPSVGQFFLRNIKGNYPYEKPE